jgi:hypothetical protein
MAAAVEPAIPLMKSRRRIATPGLMINATKRLQQGFATDEMGLKYHFAQQQFSGPTCRYGSGTTDSVSPTIFKLNVTTFDIAGFAQRFWIPFRRRTASRRPLC